ncbi:MAG: TAXI family TRAP transporter solute-binding subunit [Deltaproteobacteria bacterium]|nr:TAXI family TRAP transporter solute-binding subunit [Deltaproteobacteria bacterium]
MSTKYRGFIVALALFGVWAFGDAAFAQPTKKAPEIKKPTKVEKVGSVPKTFIMAASGPIGGTFLPYVGGLAVYATEAIEGLTVSIEATGGSTENVHLIGRKESHIGIAHGSTIFNASKGLDEYKGTVYKDLRGLFRTYGNVAHIVTLKKTGIKTVADLKGKRISMGTAGSGSAISGEKFLRHLKLWDQVKAIHLPAMEASEALKDGRIDAYNWHTGIPSAAIVDTAATHSKEMVLLDLHTMAEQSGFYKALPYYSFREIPAKTYMGQEQPVPTWDTGCFIIAHKDLDPQIAYLILKAYFSEPGMKYAVAVHASAKETTIQDALMGFTIPLHPGAVRFWEEKGLKVPPELRP